jgi:hypothetical protein
MEGAKFYVGRNVDLIFSKLLEYLSLWKNFNFHDYLIRNKKRTGKEKKSENILVSNKFAKI